MSKKTSKNLLLFIFAGLLVLVGLTVFVLKPKKLPELFPVTGAYQAYFEIETADPTSNLSQDDKVVVDVYITTSGEPFDAAVAMVEWDGTEFEYEIDSALGRLTKPNTAPHSFLATHPSGDTSKLIMSHFVPSGGSLMDYGEGERLKFASFILIAKVDNPTSKVKLAKD